MALTLASLGGAGTVTGSKHLLEFEGARVLVDCGMFQGVKNLREQNWDALPIEVDSIDAVVLTHAHLDHSGYLPDWYVPASAARSTRPARPVTWRR
ncbi:MBL fold metallo-hydrolase [Nocardioides limicola]|uniref:MBL fold metallo-hydrolase n=1 Tax=Nocardioides limicola TaxID=2803368 RepID=UPI00193BE912|nr:MBL fold metallo-hydrolase [Nocardioides sp. DJM-14]